MLGPEQEQLLLRLVDASRSAAPNEPRDFFLIETDSPESHIRGAGSRFNETGYHLADDVTVLERDGLIQRDGIRFFLLPEAFAAYEQLKRRAGEPVAVVEQEIRNYLDAADFRAKYPEAYDRWAEAARLLWGADSERELTTIGHKTREAVQQFATALVTRYQPPNVDENPARTVNRVHAVLEMHREELGDARAGLLDSLMAYWRDANTLLQRQEHGDQKPGKPLGWEDGRRAVLQTAIVMFEVDRALTG
jgi:hypothetical protein